MKQIFFFSLIFFFAISCDNYTSQDGIKKSPGNEISQTDKKELAAFQDDTINKKEVIKQIEMLSNIIDRKLKEYRQIDTTIFGYSSEGSGVIGYYDNENSIKKITVEHFSEYGNLIEHYYFDNEQLPVLVHRTHTVYDKPIFETTNPKTSASIEDLCYLKQRILLKWTSQYKVIIRKSELLSDEIKQTDENNEVIKNDSNYEKQAQKLTKYAKEYKRELSKK